MARIRRGEPVAVLLSTAVIVPFGYFLWKSLSFGSAILGRCSSGLPVCRCGHRHCDAAARSWPAWMIQSTFVGEGGDRSPVSSSSSRSSFITPSLPGISSAGPIRSAARRAISRSRPRQEQLQNTGATWIATTDYRTYAMLRWYFRDRVPVIQINERGRFEAFADAGMDRIPGHVGLYVGREPDNGSSLGLTAAKRDPSGRSSGPGAGG